MSRADIDPEMMVLAKRDIASAEDFLAAASGALGTYEEMYPEATREEKVATLALLVDEYTGHGGAILLVAVAVMLLTEREALGS